MQAESAGGWAAAPAPMAAGAAFDIHMMQHHPSAHDADGMFGLARLSGDGDNSSGGSSASPPPLLPLSSCGDSSPSSPPLFASAPPAWPHGSAASHSYRQPHPSRGGSGSGGEDGGQRAEQPVPAPLMLQTGAWMISVHPDPHQQQQQQQPHQQQSHSHMHFLGSPQAESALGSPPLPIESPRGSGFAVRLPMLPLPSPSPPLPSGSAHPASAFRPPDHTAHPFLPQHHQQARWEGGVESSQFAGSQSPPALQSPPAATSAAEAAEAAVISPPTLAQAVHFSPPAASFSIQRPVPLAQRLGATSPTQEIAPPNPSLASQQQQVQSHSHNYASSETPDQAYLPTHAHPPQLHTQHQQQHQQWPQFPLQSQLQSQSEMQAQLAPPPTLAPSHGSHSQPSWCNLAIMSQLHLHTGPADGGECDMPPLEHQGTVASELSLSPLPPLPPPPSFVPNPVMAVASAPPASVGQIVPISSMKSTHNQTQAPHPAASAKPRTAAKKKKSKPKEPVARSIETVVQAQEHKARLARESRQRKKEYTKELERRLAEHERLLQLLLSGRSEHDEDAGPLAAHIEAEMDALAALPRLVSPHHQPGPGSAARTPTLTEGSGGTDTPAPVTITSPKQRQLRRSSLSSTSNCGTPPHPSTPTLHQGGSAGAGVGHAASSPSPVSAGGSAGPSSRMRMSSSRNSLPSALDEVALNNSPRPYNSQSASPATPAFMHSSLPYQQAPFLQHPSHYGRLQHSGPGSLSASPPLHHTYSPQPDSARHYPPYSRGPTVRPGSADHGQLVSGFALPASRQIEQAGRIVSEPGAQQQQQQQSAHGTSASSGPTSRVRSRAETPLECSSPIKRGRHEERVPASWPASSGSGSGGSHARFGPQSQTLSQGPLARQVSELVPNLNLLAMNSPSRDDDDMQFDLPPASQHFRSQGHSHWHVQVHAHDIPSQPQPQMQPQLPQVLFPSPDPLQLPPLTLAASSSAYGAIDSGRAQGSWMAAGATRLQLSDATPTESMNSIFSSPHPSAR